MTSRRSRSYLRNSLGVRAAESPRADLHRECAGVLSKDDMREICAILSSGGADRHQTHAKIADASQSAMTPQRCADDFADYFLVDKGEAKRTSLMTQGASDEASPDLLDRCQQRAAEIFRPVARTQGADAGRSVGGALQARGRRAAALHGCRSAAGALDFDDLILRTTSLLSGDHGEAQWVLFKLDGGLDHILVDEAQDTSPEQWQIIRAWCASFSPAPARATVCRTVFAVGDEKQSIYSFQGAEPEDVCRDGRPLRSSWRLAPAAQWRPVPLNLSFRTVQPVLDAVDSVFADAARTPGLTASGTVRSAHRQPLRAGGPRRNLADRKAGRQPHQPIRGRRFPTRASARPPIGSPIASPTQSSDWIEGGERLTSEDRPDPRRRHPDPGPQAQSVRRADGRRIEARGIAVAGSDRIALTDQIAVQDLMVLGDFLTLAGRRSGARDGAQGPDVQFRRRRSAGHRAGPQEARCGGRCSTTPTTKPAYKAAAETLKRWRAKADFTPPFEFFSSILDRDGARAKMLHRLGPEAADAIDEFLDLALRLR